jgi:hypothetical protein
VHTTARLAFALALGLGVLASGDARAESGLVLPMPTSFGVVPASTYDEHGRRVGDAHLALEKLDDGRVRMLAESGFDGAARNVVSAILEPVDGGSALRLVSQSSRSFDETGHALGEMSVDHAAGQASCTPPAADGTPAQVLALPRQDRVANIPVNLLFLPLARGERKQIEFELMLCRGGPRLVTATAAVARRVHTDQGPRDIVEIKYDVDFGPFLSSMVRPFVPKVAVWFDPAHPDGWLAHRMPLFAKGPTVMVVRTGVAPEWLGN